MLRSLLIKENTREIEEIRHRSLNNKKYKAFFSSLTGEYTTGK